MDEKQRNYRNKLQNIITKYIETLDFDDKCYVINGLNAICESMIYSAPEVFQDWVDEYVEILNRRLADLPEIHKNKIQELLNVD